MDQGKEASQQNESNNNSGYSAPTKNPYISIVKIIAPLILAGGYVAGESFHQGYLGGYGLSESHFPTSIDEKYFSAYLALITFLISSVKPITGFWESVYHIEWSNVVSLFLVTLFIYIFIKLITKEAQVKQLLQKIGKFASSKIKTPKRLEKLFHEVLINIGIAYYIFLASASILALVVYLAGVITLPYNVGKTLAQDSRLQFHNKGCEFSITTKLNNCVEIRDASNTVIYKGLLVARHENRIGLIEDSSFSSVIYQLKSSDVILKKYQRESS